MWTRASHQHRAAAQSILIELLVLFAVVSEPNRMVMVLLIVPSQPWPDRTMTLPEKFWPEHRKI